MPAEATAFEAALHAFGAAAGLSKDEADTHTGEVLAALNAYLAALLANAPASIRAISKWSEGASDPRVHPDIRMGALQCQMVLALYAELQLALGDAKSDYLRRHKDACDRWMSLLQVQMRAAEFASEERDEATAARFRELAEMAHDAMKANPEPRAGSDDDPLTQSVRAAIRMLVAKREQLIAYRNGIDGEDDVARHARTVADGRLMQIEMDYGWLSAALVPNSRGKDE